MALPREHLLCPFRQRSSWGEPGGDGDVATLKPPGQCPLPCPLHTAPTESSHLKGLPEEEGSRWCRGPWRGHNTRESAPTEVASFESTSLMMKETTDIFLGGHRLGDNNVLIQLFFSTYHIFLSLLPDSELLESLVCI